MKNTIEVVVFVEEILSYFDEVIKGIYSDIAWYELLSTAGQYLEDNNKEFEENIEFTLNLEKEDLDKIKINYKKRLEEVNKDIQ